MGQVIIYAELNKKQYSKILGGDYSLEIPDGVELKNKAGSRLIYLYCQNEKIAKIVKDALDADGINYGTDEKDEEN